MDIQGRVVLVTGASAGIGLATARLLVEWGAGVPLVARSAETLAQVVEALRQAGHEAIALPAGMCDAYRQVIELNLFGPLAAIHNEPAEQYMDS